MSWFAEKEILAEAVSLYKEGDITKFDLGLITLVDSKQNLLNSEKIAKSIIISCEAFAAIGGFPSHESNGIKIDYLQWPRVRTSPVIDKYALQALERLRLSNFFNPAWEDSRVDLEARLIKVSSQYEDHRSHPNRGVSEYDPETSQWIDLDTGTRSGQDASG